MHGNEADFTAMTLNRSEIEFITLEITLTKHINMYHYVNNVLFISALTLLSLYYCGPISNINA